MIINLLSCSDFQDVDKFLTPALLTIERDKNCIPKGTRGDIINELSMMVRVSCLVLRMYYSMTRNAVHKRTLWNKSVINEHLMGPASPVR